MLRRDLYAHSRRRGRDYAVWTPVVSLGRIPHSMNPCLSVSLVSTSRQTSHSEVLLPWFMLAPRFVCPLFQTQKLTREEQSSLRSIRAMQVNHEEVDTVLRGRRKRIEDNLKQMQRGVEIQSKGWSEVGAVSFGNYTGGLQVVRKAQKYVHS